MISATKIYAIVSSLNGLATLMMAIFVFAKTRRKIIDFVWALTLVSASGWCLCTGIGYFQSSGEKYLFWIQNNNRFATLIPAFFFHFIVLFCNYKDKNKIVLSNYAVAVSIIFLSFLLPNQWLPGVRGGRQFLFVPTFPGYLYAVYTLFFVIVIAFAYVLLIKALFKSFGLLREQLKFLCIGTLFGFIAGGSTFPNGFGFEVPWGNYGFVLMPLIITYAVVSKKLFDIKIAITRAGIFLVVYAFVLGIPFIVLNHTGSGILATSLAVVFATMGPLIYRFLQGKAEDAILAQQRHYQRILLQAATGMVTEHDLKKLAKLIVYILKRTIKLTFAAVYIIDRKDNIFSLVAMRGLDKAGEYNNIFKEEDAFVSYVKNNREPFFIEEAPLDLRNSYDLLNKAKVVIPAFVGDELLGFVFLGEKLNTRTYTVEDMNVFKILSRQAALAVENCIFFEESKESQQRMFSAEKLASIGGMADGVAHQIKNRLNQFSLGSGELKNEIEDFIEKHPQMVSNDPELQKTFDYLKKIAVTLIDNVKRTDGVIKGILDFARVEDKENFFSTFHLKEITELAYNLLMIKHETAKLPITIELGKDDNVYGIKAQITEVIYNMLDNAYEAVQEKAAHVGKDTQQPFTPLVELKLSHDLAGSLIKISDNGIGIKDEDRHKIFAPFFTTKSSYKSGSGIGVYVVKRIIEENHKGKIWFNSTYMKGTEFFIELPNAK
jgi:signal transduction histidine kinase